ncbi:SpoIIE family protein phosphatase [Streptomyces coeruleoprunus]|uniref:SpoIIE family protein phosphatase n=1 Tax=Streptomyces coeruleoprunus TaxID=285563 RepID=UPI0035E5A76C
MTWYGAPGHVPPHPTGTAGGRKDDSRIPDALAMALAPAAASAVEAVGGYAGGVYLRSRTKGLLRLAVLAGLPVRLFSPWWRMHVNRPFPVAEAYRSGSLVLLADAEEAMRRFPQLMAGLPFPFGSLYAPVTHGRDRYGVLVVLRNATPGRDVDAADRQRMQNAASRLGAALAALEAAGAPVSWDREPTPVQLPAGATPPVRIGRLDWRVDTATVTADPELCRILGTDPDDFPGTVEGLEAMLAPEDVYGLWALVHQVTATTDPERPVSRRMWLRGRDGRPHLLELTRDHPAPDDARDPGGTPGPATDAGLGGPPGADLPAGGPGRGGPREGIPGGGAPPGGMPPRGGPSGGAPVSGGPSAGGGLPHEGTGARSIPAGDRPTGGPAVGDGPREALPGGEVLPAGTPVRGGSSAGASAPGGPQGGAADGEPAPYGGGRRAVRLVGVLVDPGTGPIVASAADRLATGVLSLDRLGRVTYVSRRAETLLAVARPKLVGRILWDVLPWTGRPAYEDHFRAALISTDPVHFLAHRRADSWLSVSLYPGHDGLTVTLTPAEQPGYTPGSVAAPGRGLGSPADRAAVLYRPVALAIALTEAVTARQVSEVVTEELLPAFGGRQLAIYLLSERHLHLAWETGFPQGFLDRFDGVGLDARLPGVETLTSGRPIFFESMQRLAAAYPGIPLDAHVGARAFLPLIASGRPVGSCILGFDQPRGFSPEERTVLTALAGLIAQALERARRYDTEAALARGLQDALLPHRLPRHRHVDTLGRYLPGTQGMDVGGDWYDVVETPRGLALAIGDVQGHGVSAAATMGQLRSAVRAFALAGHDPQEVMSGTNRLLIDLDPGQFASCCYAVLDPVTGALQAVRAGHLPPLLRHPDGRTEPVDLPGGVVLGVDADAHYPVTGLDLPQGAVLALFTDGLVEQPGTDIDVGIARLCGALAGLGPAPLAAIADRLIDEARDATDRPDDIALLLASRRTPDPARPGADA